MIADSQLRNDADNKYQYHEVVVKLTSLVRLWMLAVAMVRLLGGARRKPFNCLQDMRGDRDELKTKCMFSNGY